MAEQQINFFSLFEQFERLYEASSVAQRKVAQYQPTFEKLKNKGLMTDEQWTELQNMDYTISDEYKADETGNVRGRHLPGDLTKHILFLFFNTVTKPKAALSFENMSDEQKQQAIENQRKEIAQQMKMFWEDAYKTKEYIKIYALHTNLFPKKFSEYKSFDEIKQDALKAKDRLAALASAGDSDEEKDAQTQAWVNNKDWLREKHKKYWLGTVPGTHYDCYELPKNMDMNVAQEIQCDLGEGTEWCTVPPKSFLKDYLSKNALYIFYGNGPQDRYQFYYGDDASGTNAQFMDAKDNSILDKIGLEEEVEG